MKQNGLVCELRPVLRFGFGSEKVTGLSKNWPQLVWVLLQSSSCVT